MHRSPARFRVALGTVLLLTGVALLLLYSVLTLAPPEAVPPELASPLPISWIGPELPLLPTEVPQEPAAPAAIMLEEEPEEPDVEMPAPVAVGAPERLVIPRINVDSPVVSVGIARGEWPVPKFVVGHLAESVHPGEVGNSVFAGHLASLTSGNVFFRLKELAPGDELVMFGQKGSQTFRVTESRVVKNTDTSVLRSQPGQALVTLITCEGRWVPQDNDYDQRRVVFAEPVI